MSLQRLQKVLASAGLGSRRSCEEYIVQGRVTVDGIRVAELGTKVSPDRQEIRCDGQVVQPAKKLYFLVNKPKGYISGDADERGRSRVKDLVPMRNERIFTVNRLDASTEGLLIMTNDGDFAQRVGHPHYGVARTYQARVEGVVNTATKRELMTGVWLAGNRCKVKWVKVLYRRGGETLLEIVMEQGRNRDLRGMLAKVGHRALQLRCVKIGSIEDKNLDLGVWRKLRPEEVRALLSFRSSNEGIVQHERGRNE